MQGIKKRLVVSYLLVILFTVFLLESFLLLGIRQYYFDNVLDVLKKQAEVAGNFYGRYLFGADVDREAPALLDSFAATTSAQVQIVNNRGVLLADSQGAGRAQMLSTPDVQRALAGEMGQWQGTIPATGEPVLSVAYPLRSGAQVAGAVRFVTSLTGIYHVMEKAAFLLLFVGFMVVLLAAGVSLLLSSTITGPVEEITAAAGEMAKGRFTVRAVKKYDDEIGKLADTLNYMAEEVVRHEQLKDQFIAAISHELRTPLTSIKGWTVTLRTGDPENREEMMEGLDIIEKESDRLTLLVNELLDFSSMSSGKMRLQIDTVDLQALLHSVVRQATPRAQRQRIDLSLASPSPLPAAKVDANRVKQVLINLLDNAFKFTSPGEKVRVSASFDDGFITIEVADNGAGIPPEELPLVKQKFYKGTQVSAGSGIGLSICDEIIKLHHGQFNIDSVPGGGTTAQVILPL
ncbi:HAMP domain-containing protein [Heliobacterium gestii]|uniref:histidine kinase n=1 Tax=Heliomicrobium gestii TaxID=2699 RepID=A0A845LA21_HELGE|nr:HAMP domain-containing sensor histidine kinase [Heliomicrobium gestii]MBM7868361.1 signal transduction histidine kinase [Heliomicrobium gestii]MZP42431.1 HAMP domain-containing protein [Heliomicrobium gestii]